MSGLGHGLGDGTRLVNSGTGAEEAPVPGAPLHPGPVFAAPFHLGRVAPGTDGADYYARYDNPTLREYERLVGALDGGRTLAFASGMAALSAVLYACLSSGDRLVMPADGYFTGRLLAENHLRRFGVRVDTAATDDVLARLATGEYADARLILLETPSNPGMQICDIAAVAEIAHGQGSLVAVDNTTATPLGQQPLALGADLVLASDTKAMSGHSDLLMGHVSTADHGLWAAVKSWRDQTGAVPGPFETWLTQRSLGTLDLRLARQADNAAALSELLAAHPSVSAVRWPFAAADPAASIVARQMRRPMGVFAATLPSAEAVAELIDRSRLLVAATSFGGLTTTVDRRAQWGDDVPEGFIRISCGCEDTEDLLADVAAALPGGARHAPR